MLSARPEPYAAEDDRSIGELFSQLARDTQALIRSEARLLLAETKENLSAGVRSGTMIAGGVIVLAGGALALLASLILMLAIWMPLWASALIVGIALSIAGGLLAWSGWESLKRVEVTPEESIESIKEDARWIKERISE
ncbi:MAG TPA: phage holin family protein [Pyrinomonadaceae bacterium]